MFGRGGYRRGGFRGGYGYRGYGHGVYYRPMVAYRPAVFVAPHYGYAWYHPYYHPGFLGGSIPMWSIYGVVGLILALCIITLIVSLCCYPCYGGGGAVYGPGYAEPVVVVDPMMPGPMIVEEPVVIADPVYDYGYGYAPPMAPYQAAYGPSPVYY